MKFKLKIKDKDYDIEINEGQGVIIKVGEKEFVFDSINEGQIFISQNAPVGASLKKEIKTSLAGIISEIFIKEGDLVKSGQKLLTLSAMKMENEIISETDGEIKKVLVKKDQKVKEGEILILLA